MRKRETARAPAYTARRGSCRALSAAHACDLGRRAERLVADGIIVLVPVLKRRASVQFRHGTSRYRDGVSVESRPAWPGVLTLVKVESAIPIGFYPSAEALLICKRGHVRAYVDDELVAVDGED